MLLLQHIVIAGGGIIGNSIAYFLAKRNIPVTMIDPVGLAPGASGKAGGFLAKEWRDGTPLEDLQRLGFDLHQEIANELLLLNDNDDNDNNKINDDNDDDDNNIDKDRSSTRNTIDYRRLTCAAVTIDESRAVQKPPSRKLKDVEWVDKGVLGSVPMGNEENIAQVHPRKLCEAMWAYSTRHAGSTLEIGRVVKAVLKEKGKDDSSTYLAIKGVELEDGRIIEASKLVVACGPWTDEARSWFNVNDDDNDGDDEKSTTTTIRDRFPEITGVKCHSILVKHPKSRILNQAVFFESDGALGDGDLEVYPRPDGDCYVNGFQGEEVKMTERPGEESVEDAAVDLLVEAMEQTTSELGGVAVEPHTRQVCYWPETTDGLPIIGALPGVSGAFVATGHSVWGILQGPATGKALAELMIDGKSSCADLTAFSLDRFFF
jgi:glycine/D-amino acid oxidase-like deaminating enzyme